MADERKVKLVSHECFDETRSCSCRTRQREQRYNRSNNSLTHSRTHAFRQMSNEDTPFEVSMKVARMSKLVESTFDEDSDDEDETEVKEIPLPNVSGDVLKKVIEYCNYYQNEEEMTPIQTPLKSCELDELVQAWYANFVQVDQQMLFDLVAAANFMDIKPLLDLTCLAVSILIKGKSAEELRSMFNISEEDGEEAAAPAPAGGQETAS